MKSPDRLVQTAAKVLAAEESDWSTSPASPSAETLAAIRGALRERSRRRAHVRLLVPAFAAAAAVGALAVSFYGERTVVGSLAPLRAERVLAERVVQSVVPDEPDTEFSTSVEGAMEVVHLTRGVVRVVAGARFLIRTDEAEVEAEHAVLRVSRCSECAVTLAVQVERGSAVARAHGVERTLGAGERWTMERGATQRRTTDRETTARRPAPAEKPEVFSESELAAQNAMFSSATVAKANGDTAGAVAQFDALLSKYPASPLAEGAAVQRMRLLDASHDGRAASAARAYLSSHPQGFARREAEEILARSPQR